MSESFGFGSMPQLDSKIQKEVDPGLKIDAQPFSYGSILASITSREIIYWQSKLYEGMLLDRLRERRIPHLAPHRPASLTARIITLESHGCRVEVRACKQGALISLTTAATIFLANCRQLYGTARAYQSRHSRNGIKRLLCPHC